MAHICRNFTYRENCAPEWVCSCGKLYHDHAYKKHLFPILESENKKLNAQVAALKEYITDNT